MKQILKTIIIFGFLSGLMTGGLAAQQHQHDEAEEAKKSQEHDHEEGDHDEDGREEDDHEEGGHDEGGDKSTKLSSEQMRLANIKVAPLVRRVMNYQLYAPGEIKANGYTSYRVSPRVDSVVLRRYVALGDHVGKGQPLVTLFSETVADAQATYSVAQAEWQRVQELGRKTVGDRRYIAAKSEAQAAYGRLLAFGLSEKAIGSFLGKSKTFGEYTLVAEISGAVLTDDFQQGQRVEAGDALMELADERELWVEARLAPTLQLKLPFGTEADVKVGSELFSAHVSQESHIIDPETRTRVVRLIVKNRNDRLHSGMFADVYFTFLTGEPVLAVPEAALMRGADGDWIVFIEGDNGEFRAQEVKLGRSLGEWREISGIAAGSKVVVEGAFFVASQIAKSGFDAHNH